jgi:hypothetical protein
VCGTVFVRILLGAQHNFSNAEGISGQMKMEDLFKVRNEWEWRLSLVCGNHVDNEAGHLHVKY